MSLPRLLRVVLRDLEQAGVSWALVGGIAVGARTEPRFTADLDLAVAAADDAAAEDLLRLLAGQGYRILSLVEQTAVARLATARLQAPDCEPMVDLLFASSGIETEAAREAGIVEVFPGLRAPVATVAHLLAMKLLARDDRLRDQDRGDLRKLLQKSTPEDLARTRALLQQIRERGYHRGRDLEEALARTQEEFRETASG